MRAGELKKELESYGINTKSFLEKKELVAALQQARADGLQPIKTTTTNTAETAGSSSSSSSSSSYSTLSREERLAQEVAKLQEMKATDMKKELQERGVSTKALFEKYEFVQALAAARVDGVTRSSSSSGSGAAGSGEEGYAEYKQVEVLTDDSAGPRKKGSSGQPASAGANSPFSGAGAGANPFAGAGNPFAGGGMPGGMGGIADMLKNMGMGGMGGGAGAANPFGGGANPFGGAGAGGMGGGMGDIMGKAQQMMQNPKIMELMAKAQSNPKIMKIMNECMSNPAAMKKYENDPDVKELIDEMKKYL
jgi:hypothetical protein